MRTLIGWRSHLNAENFVEMVNDFGDDEREHIDKLLWLSCSFVWNKLWDCGVCGP